MNRISSSLSTYFLESPNIYGIRQKSIDRITIHCVVGQLNVETICSMMSKKSYNASCNYCIGSDGRIGMCVPENKISICSSSKSNDSRSITIECASDRSHPYKVNDKVYESLINLCTDICKRYNKKKVIWFGDKEKTLSYKPNNDEMVLTVHRWFANKACPGDYLYNKHSEIAKMVTNKLNSEDDDLIVRYNKMEELPLWAVPTIQKLCRSEAIKGFGAAYDKDGYPTDMDLSMDMIRMYVTIDRAGGFNK